MPPLSISLNGLLAPRSHADHDDKTAVIAELIKLNYGKGHAEKAAKYACGKFKNETLENKIKIAVQYIDNNMARKLCRNNGHLSTTPRVLIDS